MASLDKCPECGSYVNNIKLNGCDHKPHDPASNRRKTKKMNRSEVDVYVSKKMSKVL